MMRQVKNKFADMGFNSNHALLIGLAMVVFLVLVSPQLNPLIKSLVVKADDKDQPILTYEQIKQEVEAEYSLAGESNYSELENSQFALLGRTDENGQVLGSAIGIGDIPSIDQLYSPEQLELIKISFVDVSTPESIQRYSERLLRIEGYYDTLELFSVLNDSDPASLKRVREQALAIEQSMGQIAVPEDLINYHRYTVLYYRTLGEIGVAFSANETGQGLELHSKTLFSLMDRIGAIKTNIKETYGVNL